MNGRIAVLRVLHGWRGTGLGTADTLKWSPLFDLAGSTALGAGSIECALQLMTQYFQEMAADSGHGRTTEKYRRCDHGDVRRSRHEDDAVR